MTVLSRKTSILAATGGAEYIWSSPNPNPENYYHYLILPLWERHEKFHSQQLHLFYVTQRLSWITSSILDYLTWTISGNCLTLQLPNAVIQVWDNKRLNKILKEKSGGSVVNRSLWKSLKYSWESRRRCACAMVYICLGKTWKILNLSLLADLEALHKYVEKAKAELKTAYWHTEGVSQHTQSPTTGAGHLLV